MCCVCVCVCVWVCVCVRARRGTGGFERQIPLTGRAGLFFFVVWTCWQCVCITRVHHACLCIPKKLDVGHHQLKTYYEMQMQECNFEIYLTGGRIGPLYPIRDLQDVQLFSQIMHRLTVNQMQSQVD